MSNNKILATLLVAVMSIWIIACSKAPGNVNVAKVIQFEGTVLILKSETSTPIKAQVGSELLPDYVIRTVGEGRAKVQIGERAVISVEPSSSMKVRDLFKDPVTGQENTRVEFTGGKSMVNITKKLASQDSFDVMTPSAVAGVRGTEFLVDVENPESSKIAVTKGSVAMRTRIAALDDAKNDSMPVAVKEALKELAQSQEVPVRVNQEMAVDKKEAEKKNEIINQVVQVASEKMKEVMSKPDAPKESKVEAIQSALSSIVQESQKKIEISAQNNEFKKTEVTEMSAETKAKVEAIEVFTPVPIEDLKSLKKQAEPAKEVAKVEPKVEEKTVVKEEKPETKPMVGETKNNKPVKNDPVPVVKEAVGTLNLAVETEGAFVSAIGPDGKEVRLNAGENKVKPGKYVIKSERQGYKSFETTVTVEDGKTVAQRVAMIKKLVASEKIVLLDGKTIIGKVVKQDDKEVTIETEEGIKTIKMKQIDDILYLKK